MYILNSKNMLFLTYFCPCPKGIVSMNYFSQERLTTYSIKENLVLGCVEATLAPSTKQTPMHNLVTLVSSHTMF